MYQVIRGSENGNVGIKIEKKLTQDDYELLIPYIDRLRQKAGSVSLLCDMSDCEGPISLSLWGDLVDQLHQLYEIPRVAVVIGDSQDIESDAMATCPSRNTTVKYYARAELDHAWAWVEEDER